MQIVVLGDIHDRIRNLDKTLAVITADHNPELLICTGDVGNASTLLRLSQLFPGEIHAVTGNEDDEAEMKSAIGHERLLKVYWHGLTGRLTLDKRHVAFTHKHKDADVLLTENRFDIVFYGHSHQAKLEHHGATWVVNPGDIQGRFGQNPSFVLYDTVTNEPTLHTVD